MWCRVEMPVRCGTRLMAKPLYGMRMQLQSWVRPSPAVFMQPQPADGARPFEVPNEVDALPRVSNRTMQTTPGYTDATHRNVGSGWRHRVRTGASVTWAVAGKGGGRGARGGEAILSDRRS